MNEAYGSIVRSKCIGNNTYIVIISNFCSKSTPIHGSVNESELNFSYSRNYFSRLLQAVYKRLMNCLSWKVCRASMMIDSVINVFSLNKV